MHNFQKRIQFDGDIAVLLQRITVIFHLGRYVEHDIMKVGFEDFNVKLITDSGMYLVKIFSKHRSDAEIKRNVTILEKVTEAGVHHPSLYRHDDHILYVDDATDLKMVVMDFIDGKTFYESSSIPDSHDFDMIVAEAVKINAIHYDPPYLFDSWAVPNIQAMYEKTKEELSEEGKQLVDKVIERYNAIPKEQLPKCLVHGDLIKTNLIKSTDGKIYVIDFSVTNTYPRIQELAVMAENFLFDEHSSSYKSLPERIQTVLSAYVKAGGVITAVESQYIYDYCLAGAAMEYMGSVNERVLGDKSDEILYWENLGLSTLREAFN